MWKSYIFFSIFTLDIIPLSLYSQTNCKPLQSHDTIIIMIWSIPRWSRLCSHRSTKWNYHFEQSTHCQSASGQLHDFNDSCSYHHYYKYIIDYSQWVNWDFVVVIRYPIPLDWGKNTSVSFLLFMCYFANFLLLLLLHAINFKRFNPDEIIGRERDAEENRTNKKNQTKLTIISMQSDKYNETGLHIVLLYHSDRPFKIMESADGSCRRFCDAHVSLQFVIYYCCMDDEHRVTQHKYSSFFCMTEVVTMGIEVTKRNVKQKACAQNCTPTTQMDTDPVTMHPYI